MAVSLKRLCDFEMTIFKRKEAGKTEYSFVC